MGENWVVAVSAWTTASVPARVERANWYGLHAVRIVCPKCWAMLRDTTLRRRSPTTRPRMRPFGFCSATSLPSAMALLACWGRSACASKCETCRKAWVASASSRTKRKVSSVRPEGPGAAPFRVRRRALMIKASGSWRGSAGTNCMMAASMGP